MEIKACPFCGSDLGVCFNYGTNSDKWGTAQCKACGAQAGEVRTDYDNSKDAPWHIEAVKEWNNRGYYGLFMEAVNG